VGFRVGRRVGDGVGGGVGREVGFSVGMYVGGNVRERVASIVGESDGLRVGRPCKTVGGRVWPVPAKASSLKTPMTKEAAM